MGSALKWIYTKNGLTQKIISSSRERAVNNNYDCLVLEREPKKRKLGLCSVKGCKAPIFAFFSPAPLRRGWENAHVLVECHSFLRTPTFILFFFTLFQAP